MFLTALSISGICVMTALSNINQRVEKRRANRPMTHLGRHLLTTHFSGSRAIAMTSASLITIMACSTASAQQEQPAAPKAGEVQELVVTGFRHSLETALALKRNSFLPIESVAPEDIGKLPDQNVAEALQRLPGVQIDRTEGANADRFQIFTGIQLKKFYNLT